MAIEQTKGKTPKTKVSNLQNDRHAVHNYFMIPCCLKKMVYKTKEK